jgi:hypothetical protein
MSDPIPPAAPPLPPSNPPPPVVTAPEKKRGCWFYGCLTLAILAVLAAIGTWIAVRHIVRKASSLIEVYTSSNSVPVERVSISAPDFKSLQDRVKSFSDTLDGRNGARELVLSATDINALIQNDPQYKELSDKLFVILDGDQIKGRLSFPLDSVGLSQLKGKYLNGTATLQAALQNGVLDVRIKEVEVGDKPLPATVTAGLKNINLAQDMQKDEQTRTALEKLESIQVKDSKVILKARKPKE